jgi:hypothetical protein
METDEGMLKLLMQIGFLASGRGNISEAETIFSGVRAQQPKSAYPLIGKAVNRMNDMDYDGAIRILIGEALAENPESDLAKSFLGFALRKAGLDEQSLEVCREVVDAGRDEVAVAMARAILEDLERD